MRTVREEESPTLLLMAAGAVAGAAAGLYLGRRYRSFDAFVADMRGRLGDLSKIWLDDELAAEERGARLAEVVDEFEDEEEEDEDEEFAGVDEDELADDDESVQAAADDGETSLDGDEDDEDELEEEDEFNDENELEDDLVAATRENGTPDSARRGKTDARRLEQRLLRALQEEPVLGERGIEIAVVGDGVVELTGTVHAIEEVSRASALARNVPGVNMVLNRIDVRAGGSMDTASVPRQPVQAPRRDDRPAPGG